jgi:undecaprenyl-diphosphatase
VAVVGERIAATVLGLPPWLALLVVCAVPALESSAFIGFVFPGEIALLLGGVLAEQGDLSLAAVLALGFTGAVLGDSVGYVVGRRWGRRILDGTLGRLVKADHLDHAERYLAARGGRAVFLGRFTAALRVMVPGAAGMAKMRYSTFVAYNVAGAAGWVTLSVLLGYLGGSSWQHVEHIASRVGLGLLGGLVLLCVGGAAWRRARRADWARAWGWWKGRPFVRRAHSRFPQTTEWVGRRVDPRTRRGLPVSIAATALGAAGWTFAGITEDVWSRNELADDDPRIHAWVLAHRHHALDVVFQYITHMGSNIVLVPLLVGVVGVLTWRRRSWAPLFGTVVVYGGAVVLHAGIVAAIERPRPPTADWLAPASGWSYTSGHTTQAVAGWGMLVILAFAYGAGRWRLSIGCLSVVVATLVAASRIYLGVHWPTDVLGGATMSTGLLAGCSLVWLVWPPRSVSGAHRSRSRARGRGKPNANVPARRPRRTTRCPRGVQRPRIAASAWRTERGRLQRMKPSTTMSPAKMATVRPTRVSRYAPWGSLKGMPTWTDRAIPIPMKTATTAHSRAARRQARSGDSSRSPVVAAVRCAVTIRWSPSRRERRRLKMKNR